MSIPDPCIPVKVMWPNRGELLKRMLPRGGVGMELGVADGNFSAAMIELVQPRHLVMVDAWSKSAYANDQYEAQINASSNFIAFHARMQHMLERGLAKDKMDTVRYFERGITAPPDGWYDVEWAGRCVDVFRYFTAEAAQFMPARHFDWVYIDANHAYQSALNDARDYAQCVRVGGYLMFHDLKPLKGFGVDRAIEQFLSERDDFMLLGATGEPEYPTGVLRRTA